MRRTVLPEGSFLPPPYSSADMEFVTNFTRIRFQNKFFTRKTRKSQQTLFSDKTAWIVFSQNKYDHMFTDDHRFEISFNLPRDNRGLTQGPIALFWIALHQITDGKIIQGYKILNYIYIWYSIVLPMVSLWENNCVTKIT